MFIYKYQYVLFRLLSLIHLVIVSITFSTSCEQELQRFEFSSVHMGTEFRVVFYASDESLAERASQAAFKRIEELNQIMSDYLEESELNKLSGTSGSGEAVPVSEPLFQVLKHSIEISEKTDGHFDVTIGPYSQIWRGIRRELDPQLPGQYELEAAGQSVGYRHIVLKEEERTVELLKEGMKLDLGGIAKGYASDEALKILREFGIRLAFVDGGGDISTGEAPPGQSGWRIAIPIQASENDQDYFEFLLSNKAVTTSGNLFQFTEIDGIKYSHITDPRTGLGITDQIQVTVIAADGMDADAYASALSVMGFEKAKEFVESSPYLEAFIQLSYNDRIERWKSDGFGIE